MAEARIIKSLTLTRSQPSVAYFPGTNGVVDIVEIRLSEVLLRLAVNEFDYIVNEVNRARSNR